LTLFNNELIAAGQFTTAGGTSANRVAKWNGTTWSPLGEGTDARINALAVYNNELIAGGQFLTAGGIICNYIAKWNGTTWSPLGSGVNAFISSLAVYNNELIAAGSFTTAGGDSVKRIAKWNGTNWSSLGSGIAGGESPSVLSLAVYPPQTGDLIAAGGFLTAGGVTVNNIAKWNGTNWSALESGTNNIVVSLTSNSNGLFAGGQFTMVGFTSANHIARWGAASGIKNISSEIPEEYSLEQNYPNPFNSMTNIKFKMLNAGNPEIKVFDIAGKEIAVLLNEYLQAGTYEVRFDSGELPSGIYFYRMRVNDFTQTKKMILNR
jgi:hypothetical protein